MNGPSILQGIIFAILASLAGGFGGELLSLFFSASLSSLIIVFSLSLAYLLFLLQRSQVKRGRVVMIFFWLVISIGGWLAGLPLYAEIILQLSMIWLFRSLFFHSSILAALLDLMLVATASAAGTWAILQTGSFMAAVWCFFLAQSLFVAIPEITGRKKFSSEATPGDQFQNAHRVAQEAVRKLSLN